MSLYFSCSISLRLARSGLFAVFEANYKIDEFPVGAGELKVRYEVLNCNVNSFKILFDFTEYTDYFRVRNRSRFKLACLGAEKAIKKNRNINTNHIK